MLDGRELVDLGEHEIAHARGHRGSKAGFQLLEKRAAAEKSGGRIAARGICKFLGEPAFITLPRRNDELNARLSVMLAQSQHEFDREVRAVSQMRVKLERVIVPAALQTGGERAFQGRVARLFEQIHDWLADERAAILETKQLEPGGIDVNRDAFLDLHNGVVGALQRGIKLTAHVARGFNRGAKDALETKGMQFASHNRLQPRGICERHDVACATQDRRCDALLVDDFGNHDEWHGLCDLIADAGRGEQRLSAVVDAQQQLRIQLRQRIAQIAQRGDPGAMHGMSGFAQDAVDGLDRIACRAEDYQRHGVLLVHPTLP